MSVRIRPYRLAADSIWVRSHSGGAAEPGTASWPWTRSRSWTRATLRCGEVDVLVNWQVVDEPDLTAGQVRGQAAGAGGWVQVLASGSIGCYLGQRRAGAGGGLSRGGAQRQRQPGAGAGPGLAGQIAPSVNSASLA